MNNIKLCEETLTQCLELLNSVNEGPSTIVRRIFVKSEDNFLSLFKEDMDFYSAKSKLEQAGRKIVGKESKQEFLKDHFPLTFKRNGDKNSVVYQASHGKLTLKNYIPFGANIFWKEPEEGAHGLVVIYTRKDSPLTEVWKFEYVSDLDYLLSLANKVAS